MIALAYDVAPPLCQVAYVQSYRAAGDLPRRPSMPLFGGAGTGGTVGEDFYRNRSGYGTASISIRSAAVAEPNHFTLAMEQVKAGFGRTVSHLPPVFGVSRQTLYNWLNGETPKATHHDKLHELAEAAETFVALRFVPTALTLNQPILNGKGLIQLLSDGANGKEMAQRLVRVVELGIKERKRVDKALQGRKGVRPDPEDFGVPSFRED